MDEGPLDQRIVGGADLALVARNAAHYLSSGYRWHRQSTRVVFKPPVAARTKNCSARWALPAGDILIHLAMQVDHAMKIVVLPHDTSSSRESRGHAASPKVFTKLLAQRQQRFDVIERESKPLAKVTGIVPASRRG